MTKTLTALAAVAAGMLALPAAGQAATTFGSRLNNDPANAGECANPPDPGTCTLVSFIHPSDPNGDPYSGGAPVAGVITKFRIRAFGEGGAAATVTFRLADISRPDPQNATNAIATLVAEGPTVTIPASNAPETPILEFPARVTVAQGNHLALDGTNVWATYNTSGDKFSYVFKPPLVAGQGPRGSVDATGELLVQAVIEPDADGDGFGDETQDGCPTQGSNQGACDNAGPVISGVAVRGRTINYSLSEAATLTFTLQKARPGRRVRGRCRRPTRRNRQRPRCLRYVTLPGSFTDAGEAGANSLTLPRRLGGRRLGPGRYRLLITARDQFGNETQATKRFVIRRARR
ncbi:MAG TPA: hypothetical protein VF056_11225 [Thermoleophilaceae bacterium]